MFDRARMAADNFCVNTYLLTTTLILIIMSNIGARPQALVEADGSYYITLVLLIIANAVTCVHGSYSFYTSAQADTLEKSFLPVWFLKAAFITAAFVMFQFEKGAQVKYGMLAVLTFA